MDIFINDYLTENTILLNNPSTYPESWIDFLNQAKPILKIYKSTNTKNENKKRLSKLKGSYIDPSSYRNKFYHIYEKKLEIFKELMHATDFSLLCYHATRLTDEEILKVKNEGLSCFDKTTIKNKINFLLKCGYITKIERDNIIHENLLNSENHGLRENMIFFVIGNVDVSYNQLKKSSLYDSFNNYGGEIIYNKFENTDIGRKLKANSSPCIVIFKIKHSLLSKGQISSISEKIFNNYSKKNIIKIEECLHLNNINIPITDVIVVNEKSKIKYRYKI